MSNEDREFSDLKLERNECKKCGAVWINGQHIWGGTGNQGNEFDLAGLVCNKLGDENCINPQKGTDASVKYGDSWDKRFKEISKLYEDKHGEMTENKRLYDNGHFDD